MALYVHTFVISHAIGLCWVWLIHWLLASHDCGQPRATHFALMYKINIYLFDWIFFFWNSEFAYVSLPSADSGNCLFPIAYARPTIFGAYELFILYVNHSIKKALWVKKWDSLVDIITKALGLSICTYHIRMVWVDLSFTSMTHYSNTRLGLCALPCEMVS